ncbi:MAG: ATP-dependent DNA helicase RecG [Clostridia bacterium]|nr:ATP-dependent DNA helicase RecG [Clostridia bacterium]MDY5555760.1 ATP-dependent DNA helicase RecG [Blautia sp.]
MSESLRTLKGVGEKTEKLLSKIGIMNVEDLLHYYPRNYEFYEEPVPVENLKEGDTSAVSVTITSGASVSQGKNYQIVSAAGADETGNISVVWFNMPFLRNTVKKGCVLILRGRVVRKGNRLSLEQPEIFTPAAYGEVMNSLYPVYGLTKGLSNKTVVKLVREVLKCRKLQPEYLPYEYREKYQLADINFAVAAIHFPKNRQELVLARKRLVFDEFLFFILSVQMLKEKTEKAPDTFPMHPVWTTEKIIENLPYQLTRAQLNVWHEVERDLCGHSLMSRLIQGDVGSGKTILAFLAMILTVENGYQAVLMAPTEVLARQHFLAMEKLLREQNIEFCHPVLLTGSISAREKKEIYGKIESKEADIIIGTHALIQEKVKYNNLGLVITDEQHRFGVKQREALTTRGNPPNVLVMSATPIPRTLAIILYGDLDISVIDELPARRLPVKNCVVDTSYRPKAYSFIEKQVRQGRQVYVICPMVEESEGMDGENVTDYTKKLRQIFPQEINIASLHGKMNPKEKNKIMEEFAEGKIQILVSTTVVEVGVNVPNATVMMVENAERFGLAQLHQLRGRVGRGEFQSYCIFIQGNDEKETSRRLEILNKSNDGFYIAGEDLKLRGPGDLFGIRQSGDLNFRLGDIYQDADILKAASETAGEILALDENLSLEQNKALKEMLDTYMNEDLENLGI